jgi:hypothetical protein
LAASKRSPCGQRLGLGDRFLVFNPFIPSQSREDEADNDPHRQVQVQLVSPIRTLSEAWSRRFPISVLLKEPDRRLRHSGNLAIRARGMAYSRGHDDERGVFRRRIFRFRDGRESVRCDPRRVPKRSGSFQAAQCEPPACDLLVDRRSRERPASSTAFDIEDDNTRSEPTASTSAVSSSVAPPAWSAYAIAHKSSPLPAPFAVWSVCLSEPEQADVPPKALWVATTTSASRRFNSTAARKPAAPLPRTKAAHRCTAMAKPRAASRCRSVR